MKLIPDYLGREQCDSVKGIFILWVFLSHFMGYVAKVGGYVVPVYIGQMMVTLFLFYSGYGVMESIKKKGDAYIRVMPKRRILTTLLNFDIAVLVFVTVNLLLGNPMTLKQIMLSLVCWESVGNSNWYIFVIICCYLTAYITCFNVRTRRYGGIASLGVLSFYVVAFSFIKGGWWYDTTLCFPAGMIYSQYKERIEKFVVRFWWPIIVLFGLLSLVLLRRCPRVFGLALNAKAIIFALTVLFMTMRIPIRHPGLGWCGRNLFPLYIYQRVPMLIFFTLDSSGFATWRMPIYLVVSFFATIFIALCYPRWKVELK